MSLRRLCLVGCPLLGLLLVAVPPALSWSMDVVDPGPNVGAYASIKVAPDGQIHISYMTGWADLRYALYDGSHCR
jgi:hypothetical protein